MTILSRFASIEALQRMQAFHRELEEIFDRHGMNLLEDLGRRNILLSSAQERFFAETIERYTGSETKSDGRTGQSDIVVIRGYGDFREKVEIECKLTTRSSSGAINLQTDYRTLSKKECLDYLYVVAGKDFKEFAVLYFEKLTTDHFYEPHTSSRGKSSMNKHLGFQNCQALVGGYHCINDVRIRKIESELIGPLPPHRRARLEKSLLFWQTSPAKYSITLERIPSDA